MLNENETGNLPIDKDKYHGVLGEMPPDKKSFKQVPTSGKRKMTREDATARAFIAKEFLVAMLMNTNLVRHGTIVKSAYEFADEYMRIGDDVEIIPDPEDD